MVNLKSFENKIQKTVKKCIQNDLLLSSYKVFNQLNSGNSIFPGEYGAIRVTKYICRQRNEYVRVQMLTQSEFFQLYSLLILMANYTEDISDQLLKKGLISVILSQQRKIDQDNVGWLDQIRKFNDNFSKLETDLKITKIINNLLSQRVVDLKRQCWDNAQYLRRECLEIVTIPLSVDDISLEEKVIQVFEKVGCNIDSSNIETCHGIAKMNDRVIEKFSRRKGCQRVVSVKKNLQKLKWRTLI